MATSSVMPVGTAAVSLDRSSAFGAVALSQNIWPRRAPPLLQR